MQTYQQSDQERKYVNQNEVFLAFSVTDKDW